MIISRPQSEHLSFKLMAEISGLTSNSSFNIFIKGSCFVLEYSFIFK